MRRKERAPFISISSGRAGLSYSLVGTLSACANVFMARGMPACPATCSLTGIYFCPLTASVAFNIAAPMKFAVALPYS